MPLSRLTQTSPLACAAAISGLEAAGAGAAFAGFGADVGVEGAGDAGQLLLAAGAEGVVAFSEASAFLPLLFLAGAAEGSAVAGSALAAASAFFLWLFLLADSSVAEGSAAAFSDAAADFLLFLDLVAVSA